MEGSYIDNLNFSLDQWLPSWLIGDVALGVAALALFVMWTIDQFLQPLTPLRTALVIYTGNRGEGKTLSAVAWLRLARHKEPSRPVVTNLSRLDLPGDGPVICSATFRQFIDARDAICLIDEAGVYLSNLDYQDIDQREVAKWIAMSRHHRNLTILTAHEPDQVNKRIRAVYTYIVVCTGWKGCWFTVQRVYETMKAYDRNKIYRSRWQPWWPTVLNSYDSEETTYGLEAIAKREEAAAAPLRDSGSAPLLRLPRRTSNNRAIS